MQIELFRGVSPLHVISQGPQILIIRVASIVLYLVKPRFESSVCQTRIILYPSTSGPAIARSHPPQLPDYGITLLTRTAVPTVIDREGVITPVQTTNTPLSTDLIREFVIAGHGNLEKVRKMLAERPDLLNAAYAWTENDHESAIQGAAQVGSASVAKYL